MIRYTPPAQVPPLIVKQIIQSYKTIYTIHIYLGYTTFAGWFYLKPVILVFAREIKRGNVCTALHIQYNFSQEYTPILVGSQGTYELCSSIL